MISRILGKKIEIVKMSLVTEFSLTGTLDTRQLKKSTTSAALPDKDEDNHKTC